MPIKNTLRLFPLYTFIFIWFLQSAFYLFNPYGYYHITIDTWIIIIISVLAVIIGYLTVFWGYGIKLHCDLTNINLIVERTNQILKLIVVFSVLAFISTVLFFFFIVDIYGGFTSLISNPFEARYLIVTLLKESTEDWNAQLSIMNYFVNLNYIGLILSSVYVVYGKKYKIITFFPILNSIIFSIITLQRYVFINAIVIWLFGIIIALGLYKGADREKIKKKFKRFFFWMFLGISTLILLIIFLRIDYGEKRIDYLRVLSYAIKSIYSYIAGNIVALDKFLLVSDSLNYGTSLFRGVIKWFVRLGIYDDRLATSIYYGFVNISKSSFWINTYSYIRPFYEDFGIYGLMFNSYFFGLTGGFFTHSVIRKFSLLKLHFAGSLFFAYFLSFFNFTLLNITMYLYFTFQIYLIQKYLQRRHI